MSCPFSRAFVNGKVLTMDSQGTEAEAIAIGGNTISAVGRTDDIMSMCTSETEVVDLAGRVLMPGLVDPHVHLVSRADTPMMVECRDFYDSEIRSVEDVLERLGTRARETPHGEWIIGTGSPMQDMRFEEKRFPSRQELDRVCPNHPAYITFGAHILVANSRALEICSVTGETPDPAGGKVEKDPATGEPTGVLRERAQRYVKSQGTFRVDHSDRVHWIVEALQHAAGRGVTTVHDIVVSAEEIRAYQVLARDGRLPIRVHLLVRVIESEISPESLLDLGFQHGFGDDFLKLGGIKMSIDGGFTGKQSAFSDLGKEQSYTPLIRIAQDELDDVVMRYHEAGVRQCIHAIGDIAVDMALDAFEKAFNRVPDASLRHRIEHMGSWLYDADRIRRSKDLGVIPVTNPPIMYFLGDMAADVLGEERVKGSFNLKTIAENGMPIAGGSDAPGYWPIDILRDIAVCVHRRTFGGTPVSPEEAISVMQGLRAQTAEAAWLGFQENRLGTLEVGKLADLIVLDRDPLSIPAEEIKDIAVDMTVVDGRTVQEGGRVASN